MNPVSSLLGPDSPLVGLRNILALRRDPLSFLSSVAREGDIAYRRMGSYKTYLLNEPDYIRELLLNQAKSSVKGPLVQRSKQFLGQGLLTSESLDTRNAMGRFVLYILALIAQWEREAISERTRDAMRHLKANGVQLGRAPYGYRHGQALDERGRRVIEADEGQQVIISRVAAMLADGQGASEICALLNAEQVASPRGKQWHRGIVLRLLKREGKLPARMRAYHLRPKVEIRRDRNAAAERARMLRDEGMSLRQIGELLIREGLYPPRGERWHAANVSDDQGQSRPDDGLRPPCLIVLSPVARLATLHVSPIAPLRDAAGPPSRTQPGEQSPRSRLTFRRPRCNQCV